MKRNLVEFTRESDTPDADFSHLRGEAVLKRLLQRYPESRVNLERAHTVLRDEADYGAAMHRVAYSLHEGRVNAFISYRVGVDDDAARTVAEVFTALSARKVDVTYADDFTARISGQDYKSEIEAATKRSHWFVILVSDARELSGWCMYETGLFRASVTARKLERLICLHHPNASLHGAINGFQSVPGDIAHLQRFLDGLFRQPDPLPGWPALNPDLDDAAILEAATRISRALRPPRKPVAFNYRVGLTLRNPSALASAADLDPCLIETDQLTAGLFGKVQAPQTWGQLVSNVLPAKGPALWLDELVAVLKKAAAGNLVRPLTGLFTSAEGGRRIRPVLHAMELDGQEGELKFELLFLEDYASATAPDLSPGMQALLTGVRLHNRVRWEVLDRFGVDPSTWPTGSMAACAKALSRIDRELRAHGGLDAPALCQMLAAPANDDMEELLVDWQQLHDAATGPLCLALRQEDLPAVQRGLEQTRVLNQQFFDLSFPLLVDAVRGRP